MVARAVSLPLLGRWPSRLEVFAIEDTTAQFVWRDLEPGRWRITAQPSTARHRLLEIDVPAPAAVGAAVLDGLHPDRATLVSATHVDGRGGVLRRRVHTLPTPAGAELCRFATVNDLHIGASRFGTLRPLTDPDPDAVPFGDRCLTAALDEAWAWGARNLVAKGDLTDKGWPSMWARLAQLLVDSPFPAPDIDAVEGNHDVTDGHVTGFAPLADVGVTLHEPLGVRDLPGVRLVLVDTAIADDHWGRVAHVSDDLLDAASDGRADGRAVFVALHHQPQRFRVPTAWPPGIPGPEAQPFLDALDVAAPGALLATGHTHRHRRHRHRSLTIVEIGSTRDYPGTWAGYAVHEGGFRQVVRRVSEPSAIAWTEQTRWVLGGVWGAWSPGRRRQRCFTSPRV